MLEFGTMPDAHWKYKDTRLFLIFQQTLVVALKLDH